MCKIINVGVFYLRFLWRAHHYQFYQFPCSRSTRFLIAYTKRPDCIVLTPDSIQIYLHRSCPRYEARRGNLTLEKKITFLSKKCFNFYLVLFIFSKRKPSYFYERKYLGIPTTYFIIIFFLPFT